METIDVVKALADLGLTGLLLYFLLTVWKDRKETEKLKDILIAKKDDEKEVLNKEVLNVVRDNIKTQEQLRSVIQENTKATETLSKIVYDALRN
jgi:hypothetical protein